MQCTCGVGNQNTLFTHFVHFCFSLQISVSGRLAYVAQSAWIQSGTIQNNVLFGLPMDYTRYRSSLAACALDQDIAQFPFGDQTEIGERGINMSGGQKQRIQLARAVYADADIYLLDDPFSALDAHTAATLFKANFLCSSYFILCYSHLFRCPICPLWNRTSLGTISSLDSV